MTASVLAVGSRMLSAALSCRPELVPMHATEMREAEHDLRLDAPDTSRINAGARPKPPGTKQTIQSRIGLQTCLASGFLAWVFACRFRVPAATFAFPGVVAMVPGSYAFRAVLGGLDVVQAGGASAVLVAETVSLVISAAVLTIAIAVGLAVSLAIPMRRRGDM
jgi:hypothetical protein